MFQPPSQEERAMMRAATIQTVILFAGYCALVRAGMEVHVLRLHSISIIACAFTAPYAMAAIAGDSSL